MRVTIGARPGGHRIQTYLWPHVDGKGSVVTSPSPGAAEGA